MKTVLIFKNPALISDAERLFAGSDIKITVDGERHLGAVVGTTAYKEQYVKDRILKWIADDKQLTEIAKDDPHASYVAFTKGLCHRWTFIQRTIGDIEALFTSLEREIRENFLPTLIGRAVIHSL